MAMTSQASFDNQELRSRIELNLNRVRDRIVSTGRDLDSVRIVAVTKTFGVDCVLAALDLGLTHLGENYVGELAEKHDALNSSRACWHYLGALQTNKIAKVTKAATILCGVSRLKEIEKIASDSPGHSLYVQVDFTGQENRNGADPQEVRGLVSSARDLGLRVDGLMTVPSPGIDDTRLAFGGLQRLADELEIKERSMGMTSDLEIACEMGTTEVRIGRALFGDRNVA